MSVFDEPPVWRQQLPVFNSVCPYHTRRCKCSSRAAPPLSSLSKARSTNAVHSRSLKPTAQIGEENPASQHARAASALSSQVGSSNHQRQVKPQYMSPRSSSKQGRRAVWRVAYQSPQIVKLDRPDPTRRDAKGVIKWRLSTGKTGTVQSKHVDDISSENEESSSSGSTVSEPTSESSAPSSSPVSPASHRNRKSVAQTKRLLNDVFALTDEPIIPYSIENANANRVQLRQGFLSYYLPQDLPQVQWLIGKYNRWFEWDSLSVRTALDSCLLLHYAAITNDQRAVNEGQRRHSRAVQYLQYELRHPAAPWNDAILCAIASLAICCRFRRLEDTDEIHHDGLMTLLRMRGSHAVLSTFGTDLILTLLPRALTLAVKNRRKFLFGNPEWQEALEKYCDSPIKQIVLISCRIPNVLMASDKLLRGGRRDLRLSQLADLLKEMTAIEESLKMVLVSWYRDTKGTPFWTTRTEQRFSEFVRAFEKCGGKIPFETAYDYRNPLDAVYLNWYWVAILGICTPMVEVLEAWPSEEDGENGLPARDLKTISAECTEAANAICRTVPYIYCETAARRFRSSLWSQVFTALLWYQRAGLKENVTWCNGLLEELKTEDDQANLVQATAAIDQVFSGWMMLIP